MSELLIQPPHRFDGGPEGAQKHIDAWEKQARDLEGAMRASPALATTLQAAVTAAYASAEAWRRKVEVNTFSLTGVARSAGALLADTLAKGKANHALWEMSFGRLGQELAKGSTAEEVRASLRKSLPNDMHPTWDAGVARIMEYKKRGRKPSK